MDVGRLVDQQAQLLPYWAMVPPHGALHLGGGAAPASRSGLLDHLTPRAALSFMNVLCSGEAPMMQIRSVGGAVNDLGVEATAYAHRHQNFAASALGFSPDRLNARWDAEMSPHADGIYLSFDTDRRPERLNDAFPGETLTKLRRLKALYHPENVFNQNFPITPATHDEPVEAAASLG